MGTIVDDRIPRQVPHDGQEFLREDAENMIKDPMSDVGNGLMDIDANRTLPQRNGGIVYGLGLSTVLGDNDHIYVAAGTLYDRRLARIDATGVSTISIAAEIAAGRIAAGSTDGYIVARYTLIGDPATEATHPFSGEQFYKRRKMRQGATDATFFELTTAVPAAGLVTNGTVYIGRWILDAGILKLFDRASMPITDGVRTLTIYPYDVAGTTPTTLEVRGAEGNKYWVRFRKEVGNAVVATESVGAAGTNAHYLDVTIPTDSAGVVVATFNDVYNAINVGSSFIADLTGVPVTTIFSGATYLDTYTALSGGNSYRQYYQAKAGSVALVPDTLERFTPDDPYTKHLMSKGRAPVTDNNPHGMDAEDIPGYIDSWQDHQRREHNRDRSGISKGSDIAWLALSGTGTNTVSVAAGAATDRAIVNGLPVAGGGQVDFSQAVVGSFAPYTAEFILTQSGAIVKSIIAQWNTGAANIAPAASPNEALFSITDKHPDLTGTDTITLVSTGAAYTMTLGTVGLTTGPAVTVTTTGTEYTIYRKDGKWVKVYHEAGFALLGAGTYANTVDFVVSTQQDTGLSVGIAAWRNGGGGRLWGHLADTRVYGTMSVEHDAYAQIGDTLDYGCRYSGDTLLAYVTGGFPITHLRPFEVDYRGRTYRFDSFPIANIAPAPGVDTTPGVHNFLVVRFDAANVPTITTVGNTLTGTWNKYYDVLLGDLVHDALGHPSITSSHFFQQTGDKGYRGTHIRVSAYAEGWDIDDALSYLHTVCLDTTIKANTVFLLELMSNVSTAGGAAAYTVGRLMIKGNRYNLTGSTVVTVTDLLVDNTTFVTDFRFVQPAVAATTCTMSRFTTNGAYLAPFLSLTGTSAKVEMDKGNITHGGGFAAIYAAATAAQIRVSNCDIATTAANSNLLYTAAPGGGTSTILRLSGGVIGTIGPLLRLDGTYNSIEIDHTYWGHSSAFAAITYGATTGSFVLRMDHNTCAWTRTDAVATAEFISVADAGDPLAYSSRLIGNEFTLTYNAATTSAALISIAAGPTAYSGTGGIAFEGNLYRVTATGCTGAVVGFGVLLESMAANLLASVLISDETIHLIGNTDVARHTADVAGAVSYRVDGLEFVVDDQTHARTLGVQAYGDVATVQNVTFPAIVFTPGGNVSSAHTVDATAKTVSVSNIVNAAGDASNPVTLTATGTDSTIQAGKVSGQLSTSGALVQCAVNAAYERCMVMVSGCCMKDPDVDVTALTAAMTTPHHATTTGFCVGNTQKAGSAAVATGFDVSSNHFVA